MATVYWSLLSDEEKDALLKKADAQAVEANRQKQYGTYTRNEDGNYVKTADAQGVPAVQGGPVTVTAGGQIAPRNADFDAALAAAQKASANQYGMADVAAPVADIPTKQTYSGNWGEEDEAELLRLRGQLMNGNVTADDILAVQSELMGSGAQYNPHMMQTKQAQDDLIEALRLSRYRDLLAERDASSPYATASFLPNDPTKQTVGGYLGDSFLGGLVGSLEGSRNFVVDLAAENARNDILELLESQNASGVDPTALIDAQRAAGLANEPQLNNKVLADRIRQYRDTSATKEWQNRVQDYGVASDSVLGVAGNVAAGVGGMLPAIGANALPIPGLGSAVLFSSAAGNAVNEALANGANYDEAFTYGVVTGATEIATEKILGGIPGLNKGWLDNLVNKAVSGMATSALGKYLVKMGADALGEGFEEWLSEAIGQYTVRIYDEAAREQSVGDVWREGKNDRLYAALIGALTSAVMQAPTVNSRNVAKYNAELQEGIKTALKEDGLTDQAADAYAQALVESEPEAEQPTTFAEPQIATSTTAQAAQSEAQQTTDVLSAELPQTGAQQPTQQQIEDELVSMVTGEPVRSVGEAGLPSSYISSDVSGKTSEEAKRVIDYLRAVDTEIKSFAQQYISGNETKFKRKRFSEVSERQAADIKRLTGIDVEGFDNGINKNGIDHIKRRHGATGKSDSTMADVNDIARIPYVLENYDEVQIALDKHGKPSTSYEFRDANDRPAPQLKYSKRVDGTIFVVEAIPDSSYKTLWVTSAYITKKGSSDVSDAKASHKTSETAHPAEPFSSVSIAKSGSNGKSKFAPNTVGAAQSNPNSYDALISKYGALPEGEIPSRYAPVPKRSADGNKVSLGARTVMESNVPNEFVQKMEDAVARGDFSYYVNTNEMATTEARRVIAEDGYDAALRQWRRTVQKPLRMKDAPIKERLEAALGVSSKNDMALGIQLFWDAVSAKNYELSEQLAVEICAMGTSLGQGVQAMSMLKRATPMGQLYYTTLMVERLNEGIIAKYRGKVPEIKISEDLKNNLLAATSEQEIDDAMDAIKQNIADQVPVTWIDKWNEWRYLSMLGNAKTHLRNMLGNIVMGAATDIKSSVAAGIERAVIRDGERSTAVLNRRQDVPLLEFAAQDYETMSASLEQESKYSNAALSKDIENRRAVFKTKWLEKARRANSDLLAAEDKFFSRKQYEKAFARYMKANGLTAEQLSQNTTEARSWLNKARAKAVDEAQKATFQEANALANALNRMKSSHRALDLLLNGLVPFTKTPLNILRRGFSYSPAGLIVALGNAVPQINKGKYTATEVVNQIAEGLTGTGVTLLGMLLYSLGALTGAPSEEKKEKEAQERTGWQEYSLHIGDTYYSLDWLAPISMPLFVGVELGRAVDEEDMDLNSFVTVLSRAANPMFEMSMLQGIIDATSRMSYGGDDAAQQVGSLLGSAVTSYVTQGIPTLFGQLARSVDPTRRETYVTGDKKGAAGEAQKLLNKAMSKTPGASYLLEPYVDEWGRTEVSENPVWNTVEQFLSPGYTSQENRTEVDDFLDALYERVGETSVYPTRISKNVSMKFDGNEQRLTSEQRTEYAQVRGQTSYDMLADFMASRAFDSATDAEKAAIVNDIYEYATYAGKKSVGADLSDDWRAKADALADILDPVEYVIMREKADTNGKGGISNAEAEAYIDRYLSAEPLSEKAKIWKTVTGGADKNNPYL